LPSDPHPRAAVIGANGQDGRLICRRLCARGYDVLAIGRQPGFAESLDPPGAGRIAYDCVELRQRARLAPALTAFRPDVVFHLAAVHASSAGNSYENRFAELIEVNTLSLHETLETLRTLGTGARVVYASSAKVFGADLPMRVTETTGFRSDCLYALSKNAARDLIAYYRRVHALPGAVLFFFNHESELRPPEFFIPKLVAGLAGAMRDRRTKVELATLDFHGDWGSAEEYMDIAIDVAERAPSTDLIVATGRTIHARELAENLFAAAGLNYRDHIVERGGAPGQGPFQSDLTRLKEAIGRVPVESVFDLCRKILAINHDLDLAPPNLGGR
jgi:GDPmannose 4,6-dehydratase